MSGPSLSDIRDLLSGHRVPIGSSGHNWGESESSGSCCCCCEPDVKPEPTPLMNLAVIIFTVVRDVVAAL